MKTTTHTVKFKVLIEKEEKTRYLRNSLRYLTRITDSYHVPVWNIRGVVVVSPNELYIQMSSTRAAMLLDAYLVEHKDQTDIKSVSVVGTKIVLKFSAPRKKKEKETNVDISGMTLEQIQELVNKLTKENESLTNKLYNVEKALGA